MRTMRSVLTLAVLVIIFAACSKEPKTTEEVLKDIGDKAAKINTYSADFDMAMNMGALDMKFGGNMQGKEKLMAMTLNMEMMNQNVAMKMVTDQTGITWMEMDMMELKQVMKMDMAQAQAMQEEMIPGMPTGFGGMGGLRGDPRSFADQFSKTFDMTYTGKEKLEDEDVYVLTGKLKEELKATLSDNPSAVGAATMGMDLGSMMDTARMKIGVKDGFPRSAEMLDKDGKAWMTQTYKNVKLDVPIDDALFAYTPPDGAQVMDMSEVAGEAMHGQEDAPQN